MDLIEETGNESIEHKNLKHDLAARYDLKPEFHIGPYSVDLAEVRDGHVYAFYEIVKTCTPTRIKLEAMLNICTRIYFITLEGQVSRLGPDWTVKHAFWLWEWEP